MDIACMYIFDGFTIVFSIVSTISTIIMMDIMQNGQWTKAYLIGIILYLVYNKYEPGQKIIICLC